MHEPWPGIEPGGLSFDGERAAVDDDAFAGADRLGSQQPPGAGDRGLPRGRLGAPAARQQKAGHDAPGRVRSVVQCRGGVVVGAGDFPGV